VKSEQRKLVTIMHTPFTTWSMYPGNVSSKKLLNFVLVWH